MTIFQVQDLAHHRDLVSVNQNSTVYMNFIEALDKQKIISSELHMSYEISKQFVTKIETNIRYEFPNPKEQHYFIGGYTPQTNCLGKVIVQE